MTPEISKKLSLYELERELVELVEFSEDAKTEEETATARSLIGQYLEKRAEKVDSILGYLKHCDMMAECAKEEAQAQMARSKTWAARRDRLKDACIYTMQQFDEKRLTGRIGELQLQANPASVEVYDQSLLPFEYSRVSLRMPGDLWAGLVAFIATFSSLFKTLAPDLIAKWNEYRKQMDGKEEPDLRLIAAALKTPCRPCGGSGKDHGKYSRLEAGGEPVPATCEVCSGSGHKLVPGARLVTDKQHLRIT